jgi:hypothetical protein
VQRDREDSHIANAIWESSHDPVSFDSGDW